MDRKQKTVLLADIEALEEWAKRGFVRRKGIRVTAMTFPQILHAFLVESGLFEHEVER